MNYKTFSRQIFLFAQKFLARNFLCPSSPLLPRLTETFALNKFSNSKGVMKRGISIVELLVAIAIFLVIGAISVNSFLNFGTAKRVDLAASTVLSAFDSAKNDSITSKNGVAHGVYVASSSVTLFNGSTYNSSDASNTILNFPSDVVVSTSTLTQNSSFVIFSRLLGQPSATGTIILRSTRDSTITKTIRIYDSGIVKTE